MSAHKDRLIQAADLLGMTPDDLTTLLESAYRYPFADSLVGIARERQALILDGRRVDPEDARTLARAFRELDIHLSAGGDLPREWRPADDGVVRKFDIAPGAFDNSSLQAQLHAGQDVLVLGAAAGGMLWVEALDGAEFDAFPSELSDGATTPADRFAGYHA